MGVRRAVELALDAPLHCKAPIFTFGPLIHNPQVLNLLKEKGIIAIDDIPETGDGTILIRAHGVPPETKNQLEAAGFNVIDATCPKVIRVQTIIDQHARKGYATLIVGDKDHPEVIGLLGFSRQNGHVIANLEEAKSLPCFEKAVIVAQTTQNTVFFEAIKTWVRRDFPHYKIFDTICDSTENRQAEVRELAGVVDALVVVGGRNSGNTQRLAHIARETGVATFHVETEDDLDPALLSKAKRIGLTAGASTPNWIIKRVYRTLETLPASKIKSIASVLFNFQRSLLLTNTYAALGAGCLCYAASRLQGISGFLPAGIISMLYILTMHVMNNLTGSKADRYNDPDRAAFYKKHKIRLVSLALAAGLLCLAVAWSHGIKPFLVISLMSLMGLSYNLRLAPKSFFFGKHLRIRDIPGSKTILIAMAWGVVTSIYPLLTVNGKARWATLFAFLWTTSLVFARTAFSDITDVQGDRIVGKETIPILLGEKKTMRILKIISAGMGAVMLIAGTLKWVPGLAFLLSICPLSMLAIFIAHERGRMMPGIRLAFLIESHFVLAGVLTFLWSVL